MAKDPTTTPSPRASRKRKPSTSTSTDAKQVLPVRWLPLAEAVIYTGYSKSTLKRAVVAGQLHPSKGTPGRACPVKFDLLELDRWMISNAPGLGE